MLAQSVNILKIYLEKLITVIAFERRLGVTGGTLRQYIVLYLLKLPMYFYITNTIKFLTN